MKCRHANSITLTSRGQGRPNAKDAPFAFVKYRRRECLGCGARFGTFELTEKTIKAISKAGPISKIGKRKPNRTKTPSKGRVTTIKLRES
jgi:transcriptional regulator NrdR family protein